MKCTVGNYHGDYGEPRPVFFLTYILLLAWCLAHLLSRYSIPVEGKSKRMKVKRNKYHIIVNVYTFHTLKMAYL